MKMLKFHCQKNIAINIKMPTYCLVCKKNIENIGSKWAVRLKTSNNINLKLFMHSLLWNMLRYYLKCKKDRESVDSKVLKTKNGRPKLSSKCAVCSY